MIFLIKLIVSIIILLLPVSLGGQTDSILPNPHLLKKTNSINFEAFGHGLYYSVSYEKVHINDYMFKLSTQIGIAVYPYPNQIDIWLPLSINYIKPFGVSRKHNLELGIGHLLRYDQLYVGSVVDPWQTAITAKIGYRYQKTDGRWIFKVLFTPFYEYDRKKTRTSGSSINYSNIGDNPYPSGALSIGYTF